VEVAKHNIEHLVEDIYILQSGIFYFCEDFIISEINEGVHFTWDDTGDLIDLAYQHYGNDRKISYISNRINKYSVRPQDWIKFFKEDHNLEHYAIVTYNKISFAQAAMEKFFFKSKMKRFENLALAIQWVQKMKQKSA